MNVSIFYVTFRRDIDWMIYSLRSVDKFTSGFTEVVVAVPNDDKKMFEALAPLVKNIPFKVIGHDDVPGKGMLLHEAILTRADEFCTGDIILHMDGDCLFWDPSAPEDFLINGKPIVYREDYELFKGYCARYSWKECVKNAIGVDAKYETMVSHPMLYRRDLYPKVRDAVQKHTGVSFMDYVLSCRNEWPQSYAEHPTLGAFALENDYDNYHWIDFVTPNNGRDYVYEHGRNKVVAFWSHGGTERYLKQLEEICPSPAIRV